MIIQFMVGTVGGYRFAGNSYEIFERYFGSTNIFNDQLDENGRDQYGSMFGDAYGGQVGLQKVTQPEDIVVTLDCTLHEFYNGCLKRIEFERDVL